jgi:uncharacterized protein YkwD
MNLIGTRIGRRARRALVLGAAGALALLASVALAAPGDPTGCAGADTRPAIQGRAATTAATLCLINEERARQGLPPLRSNRRLGRAATGHAREMVRRDYFAHISAHGSSVGGRLQASGYASRKDRWAAGEALAWGTGEKSTAREIVTGWMNSLEHRYILLTPRFRDAGIGVARGAPGPRRGGTTYTLDLACRC